MQRLFVAVDIPDEQIPALEALQDDSLRARWTPSEQYHLTLRFVGDVPDEATEKLSTALREVNTASFQLSGEGLDVFPSRRRPRVLVARIHTSPALSDLQAAVNRTVVDIGLDEDPKPFNPHVTFARLKGARPRDVRSYMKERTDFRIEPFAVREFHLYRSDLGSSGAVHTILETYPLGD